MLLKEQNGPNVSDKTSGYPLSPPQKPRYTREDKETLQLYIQSGPPALEAGKWTIVGQNRNDALRITTFNR